MPTNFVIPTYGDANARGLNALPGNNTLEMPINEAGHFSYAVRAATGTVSSFRVDAYVSANGGASWSASLSNLAACPGVAHNVAVCGNRLKFIVSACDGTGPCSVDLDVFWHAL